MNDPRSQVLEPVDEKKVQRRDNLKLLHALKEVYGDEMEKSEEKSLLKGMRRRQSVLLGKQW